MHAYAFDVVGELAFGKAFGFLSTGQDVRRQMASSREWLKQRFTVAMVPWLFPVFMSPLFAMFSSASREQQENEQRRNAFTAKAIRARMTRAVDRRDMLGRFMEAKHPDGTPLSVNKVLEESMTVVAAGSDTTAIALRAILYYLIQNERVYDKLVNEIDAAAKEGKISDPITYAESLTLSYFCACVKEAFRLHSPVGYLLPRYVPQEGRTIAGRYFSAGSIVGMHPWTIHHDPAIFGPEPEKFIPERWLQSPESTKVMERYNLVFGQGARICIGKNIAVMEIQKLIPTLLRRFRFELVDPKMRWN